MKNRRLLTQREKQAIKIAWNYKCAYCRSTVTGDAYHIDHIIPFKHGGKCEIENLALSCIDCNLQKKDTRLPRLHEGLLIATAARKAPKVRERMKQTRVSKTKLLNTFLETLSVTIDGYSDEIDEVEIPVRFCMGDDAFDVNLKMPLKGAVYEAFVPEDKEQAWKTDTKFAVLDRLVSVKERTKRSHFVREMVKETGVSYRCISRHIKEIAEQGHAKVRGCWIYPITQQ